MIMSGEGRVMCEQRRCSYTTSKQMVQKYLPIRQNEPIRQGSGSTSKFYNPRKFLAGLNVLCTFKKNGEGEKFFILPVLFQV